MIVISRVFAALLFLAITYAIATPTASAESTTLRYIPGDDLNSIIRSMKYDDLSVFHLGSDGVLRTFSNNLTILDYHQLDIDQVKKLASEQLAQWQASDLDIPFSLTELVKSPVDGRLTTDIVAPLNPEDKPNVTLPSITPRSVRLESLIERQVMSSNTEASSSLLSHDQQQRMVNQKELSQILKGVKHDLTLNGVFSLGKDGVLRSLTADREVVDAVALRPELIKALLDRMPHNPQAEIDYRGVDGTKVPQEKWFHPDRSLLPAPFTPPEERRNLSPEQLEKNRQMLENRPGQDIEPQMLSDHNLELKVVVTDVFAIIIVGLTGYSASVFNASSFHGYGMSFFTFAWTILLMLYVLCTPFFFPEAYNYWLHLIFESLTTLFTLVTFALIANEVSAWTSAHSVLASINKSNANKGFMLLTWPAGDSALNSLKAALTFAVAQWVLFVISLFVVSMFIHRHRLANNESGFFGWRIKRKDTAKDLPEPPVPPVPASASQGPVEMPNVEGAREENSSVV
ncbi:hypothetical protein B7463_g9097, partial [Scytalidium lignicola]